jgi:hypothetical protein
MTDQTNYRDDLPDENCPSFPHECDNCDDMTCDYYQDKEDEIDLKLKYKW